MSLYLVESKKKKIVLKLDRDGMLTSLKRVIDF